MRSPKPLWPRTQDLDARQRTESQAARLDSSRTGRRRSALRARPPAAPRRRREPTRLLFLALFVLCYFGAPRASRTTAARRGDGHSFLRCRATPGGAARSRWWLRHQRAIAAIEATRPSRRSF